MPRRHPIVGLAVLWVFGTWLSRFVPGFGPWAAMVAAMALLCWWFAARRRLMLVGQVAWWPGAWLGLAVLAVAIAWADPFLFDRNDRDFVPTDSACVVEGSVAGDPDIEPRGERAGCWTFPFRLREPPGLVTVRWYGSLKGRVVPAYGERWRLRGRIVRGRYPEHGSPWRMTTNARRSQYLGETAGAAFLKGCFALRRAAAAHLSRGLETHPEAGGMLHALLLGYRSRLSARWQTLFRQTGTMHIFALSGLHVGMVAGLIVFVLIAAGLPRTRWAYVLIPALLFYTFVTGAKPSAVRALVMASVYVVALPLRRRPDAYAALAAAAIVMLLFRPSDIQNAGFVMSFTVVLGILLFYGHIERRLAPLWRPDPFRALPEPWQRRWLRAVGQGTARLAALSLAAWLASAPLTALWFGRFIPVALLANLVVVPLTFLIVTAGFLSLTLGVMIPGLGILYNHAALALVELLTLLMRGFASLPGGSLRVTPWPVWAVLLWYGLMLLAAFWLEAMRTAASQTAIDDSEW